MPSGITHELIAKEAAEHLPQGAKEAVFAAPDYYFLGAQGPDLFFFYPSLGGNLGRRLHREQVYGWFSALLSVLPDFAGEDFSRCLAYALGACSHLSADVTFHPFVYRLLEASASPKHMHQEIENDWDVYFLRAICGASVKGYAHPFNLGRISADGVLFRYLSRCAKECGIVLRAGPFRACLTFFGIYLDRFHGAKLLRPFGLGYLYPNDEPDETYLRGNNFWALSGGKGKNADELFRRAASESAERVTLFLDCFNESAELPREKFSLHYLTGEPL